MTDIAAIALPTTALSQDEQKLLSQLRGQLTIATKKNQLKQLHHKGRHKARSLDIAVPPQLADLDIHVGFAATVVDTLAERIEWDHWISTGDLMGLDDIYRENSLDVEGPAVVQDSLITGMGFVSVGTGGAGEPEVLVTGESPNGCTDIWDRRTRRATAALSQTIGRNNKVTQETLYLPEQTIKIQRNSAGKVSTIDRDEHNLGRVQVVRFPNMQRTSDVHGTSEITAPIRYYCDHAARTLLGMEINREFYTAPQRYGLGVDPSQFGLDEDSPKDERVRKGWEISMTRMNFLPRDEDTGELPTVGQFASSPPSPYIDEVKHCAQLIASAAGLPATYMGFTTENPPSGDSIRQLESRLIKRARLRQRMFGRSWREVAYLALLVRDLDVDPGEFAKISENWLNPATPTPAADADRTVKLVQANVLPADSEVTYREAGVSARDQEQLSIDKRRGTGRNLAATLADAAKAAAQDPAVNELANRRASISI